MRLHRDSQSRLFSRKEQLLLRSASLRSALQQESATIGEKLSFVDRTVACARSPTGRWVIAGGAILILLFGPPRLLRLAPRMLIAWSTVRPLFLGYAHAATHRETARYCQVAGRRTNSTSLADSSA